ncbi:Secoisolariciresinol dehydrogenase [Vitis vinifera]|uniref:Secoisolariciresinol dehydrogenase n=1 Tax=Vitis vinifera TaxID=29760 RepID=A0A438JAY2_VITVI|nr:Secoisolariciresinol dehydrogenase [Vitis vinifera]
MMSAAIPITQRLAGKVALITGGASGIGECTARLFVKHGAKVIVADVQDQLGRSLCQKLVPKKPFSTSIATNAGISGEMESRIILSDNTNFKRVFDVNAYGAFLAGKHAARVMIPAKTGCIIFTASVVSVVAEGAIPYAYVASKHAVVGLANNLCVELGQYGIRVNCISPFGVATPMLRQGAGMIEKSKVEDLVSSSANLKGIVLEAEDVAKAALYLGSDDSKYVSGMNLVVDGGYSITNPSFGSVFKTLLS